MRHSHGQVSLGFLLFFPYFGGLSTHLMFYLLFMAWLHDHIIGCLHGSFFLLER
jgi:hypothetical protein